MQVVVQELGVQAESLAVQLQKITVVQGIHGLAATA
jgi:hypothetical protein